MIVNPLKPFQRQQVYIMKAHILSIAIAGLFLTAFCALDSQAKPKVPADVAGLLTQAYTDLDQADHDYKGHRIKAMHHIEAAGKILHLNLRGDGKGREKQGVSDEHLAAAQGTLGQIQSQLAAEPKSRVLHKVNKAQEELATALTIK
jgi:hypothetical protein